MLDNIAVGVYAAGAWARINALFVLTGQVTGTTLVYDTLRSAVRRTAHVIRQARARREAVDHPTLGIRSARRWDARIATRFRGRCYFYCTQVDTLRSRNDAWAAIQAIYFK